MNDLCYLSAAEAAVLFRAGKLSPVELLDALIERADEVEPQVNAFTERLYARARWQARDAEARFRGTGPAPRALEGIPVAAKEKHALAGYSLSEGSVLFADAVAEENAPVVDRIEQAGGIVHARTTTPEFSIATFTHGPLWGVTRNPWNREYSPGGSSGGSAAALAAGTTTLASASDIAGSTRVPAAFTGLVGYKAPYGRIPGKPPLSADYYRGDGPLARTVDDAILFANALIGPDPRDHASLPRQELPLEHPPAAGMRVAVCETVGDYPVTPEVAANTRATAAALEQAGVLVEEVTLPWRREEITYATAAHFSRFFGAFVAEQVSGQEDRVAPYTARFLESMQQAARSTSVPRGLAIEARVQRQLAETLQDYDVLLCPTAGVPAFPAGDDLAGGFEVDGVRFADHIEATMAAPFNIANRCPVLAVPSGHASTGVPTGVQIVGRPHADAAVFRLGKELERIRPWAYTENHRPAL
ncbi:amidase [Salinifilum ghardaiensis]